MRAFAGWIDGARGHPRQHAFAARETIRPLRVVERAQLVRWLAWLCAATASQGRSDLPDRLRKLDRQLHAEVTAASRLLPAASATPVNAPRIRTAHQGAA